MGFFSKMIGATVKTVITPVAVVVDAAKVVAGKKADTTENLIEDAVEDIGDGLNDLADGEL